MQKIKYQLIIIMLLMTMISTVCQAQGLSVDPAKYYWKNVSIGQRVKCPELIKITNKSNTVTSYSIKAAAPSNLGLQVDKGFEEIPFRQWITFDKKHIATNPNETVSMGMYIDIPKNPDYLNKNWEFIVSIQEHIKPSSIFNLVCDIKVFVSTTQK